MQFGFTLKPDLSVDRILGLTRQAEQLGFQYGWIFDSHILWKDPYPLLALMAVAYGLRNLLWFAPEARFLLPAFVPIVYGIAAGAWMMSRMARWPAFACLDLAVLALLPFAYFGLV